MTALNTDPWVGKDWEEVEIPRDGMNRPMVMNPAGTKRVAYRRTTTFVGVLEDRYNLEQWKVRQVAWGMGQRDDLVLKASSVHIDDKKALDEVGADAMAYAQSSAKATKGTALHKLCERLDRGQPLGRIPPPFDADIRAYEACMKKFKIKHSAIESFRVHDDWRVAGTTDRISEIDGRHVISDIKTGDIDRISKIVMQLAMYQLSVPYDIATDTRGTDPVPLDLNRALVIHLPAGEGRCELHWVDIEQGRRGLQACWKVFNFRGVSRKKLTWPVQDQQELNLGLANINTSSRTDYDLLVDECDDLDELKALYLEAKNDGQDTRSFNAAVKARKAALAF